MKSTRLKSFQFLLFLTYSTSFLGGCQYNHIAGDSSKIVNTGWARPPAAYCPKALYCYRTLGDVECYELPQTNGANLVGHYSGQLPPEPPPEPENNFFSFLPNFRNRQDIEKDTSSDPKHLSLGQTGVFITQPHEHQPIHLIP